MTTLIEAIVAGVRYTLTDQNPYWVDSVNLWGMAPGHLLESRGAEQNGTTVEDFRLDPRDLELIIGFAGVDDDLVVPRRTLLSIFQRRSDPLSICFTFYDGSVRQIDGHLNTGLGFARGGMDHNYMLAAAVIHCPDPTFYDPAAQALTFQIGGGAGGSVPTAVPTSVGASIINATTDIVYGGTAPSPPTLIRINGPITSFVLSNATTGDSISAKAGVAIADGAYVDLDCRYGAATAITNTGANWIANLADADDLTVFHIAADPEAPGGVNAITLTGTAANADTLVAINYLNRYLGA